MAIKFCMTARTEAELLKRIKETGERQLDIPNSCMIALKRLEENGYEAYLVGGCVRDMLMGRNPKDYDIATSALPEQLVACFTNTVETGIRFGTVTVIEDGVPIEVTTFRRDGEYRDGRHPQSVCFATGVYEDASRRDFTVNSLYLDRHGRLTDLFDGRRDLEKRLIRAVGDPSARFEEDALRILRAFRFCAVLSFEMDQRTYSAALGLCQNLSKVSVERILSEIRLIIGSDQPEVLAPLIRHGGLGHLGIQREKGVELLSALPPRPVLRMAAFLILGMDNPLEDMAGLPLTKQEKRLAEIFLRESGGEHEDIFGVKRLMSRYGPEFSEDLLCLWAAKRAKDPEECGKKCESARQVIQEILADGECYSVSQLAVNGGELAAYFKYSGEKIGNALSLVLDYVIENPAENTREAILSYLSRKAEK